MFVYLTFSMTLEEVIAGCEDAWAFFGGVFAVVVPDNMSPVVAKADAVNPRLTREWQEYAQARGFVTDPARVRHPRDKPRVEAGVKFVQGSFFAGETFLDLADARPKMTGWLGGELVDRLGVGVDPGAHLDAPSSLSGQPAARDAE